MADVCGGVICGIHRHVTGLGGFALASVPSSPRKLRPAELLPELLDVRLVQPSTRLCSTLSQLPRESCIQSPPGRSRAEMLFSSCRPPARRIFPWSPTFARDEPIPRTRRDGVFDLARQQSNEVPSRVLFFHSFQSEDHVQSDVVRLA